MFKNMLKHLAKEIKKNKETREKSKDKTEINKLEKFKVVKLINTYKNYLLRKTQ